MKKLKVLVFSAHPDDLETGLGGTLLRLKDAGHEIVSIVAACGTGLSSRERRANESKNAHRLLGIKPQIDSVFEPLFYADKIAMEKYRGFITEYGPDVVFTHSPNDVHPHHRTLAILAMGPCLEKGIGIELLQYEVASITHPQTLGFFPTHYVDIGDVMRMKDAMIGYHVSQGGLSLIGLHEQMVFNRAQELNNSGITRAEAFIRLTRTVPLIPELKELFIPTPFVMPRSIGAT